MVTTFGKVYLVGAGPGDAGLLTLRAATLLAEADVVMYDALVDETILRLANPEAELVFVGKRAGKSRTPQDEINRLLIEHARAGKTVVRLKGGDPFLFGRGGEEALALADAGVPFEVVPGVTAASAAGAYAGIPLTHRGLASVCVLVTGHEDPSKPDSDVNWSALAAGGATLCFYMGLGQLDHITKTLIDLGRPSDEGAALIASGTLPEQKVVLSTLSGIADAARDASIEPPAMLIVGPVTSLRERLKWFEHRPLFGRTVVVTRPAGQSAALIEKLTLLSARPVLFPTIELKIADDLSALDDALEGLSAFDWTVFSSVNAVRVFFDRLAALKLDARASGGCQVAAIGPATADALARLGIKPDCVPEKFVAESLLEALTTTGDLSGKRLLVPRSDIGRDVLTDGLRSAGAEVPEIVVYSTTPAEHSPRDCRKLVEMRPDVITFTSSSTVINFVRLLGEHAAKDLAANAVVASIGPVTSEALRAAGLPVHVSAAEHTIDGLLDALLKNTTS